MFVGEAAAMLALRGREPDFLPLNSRAQCEALEKCMLKIIFSSNPASPTSWPTPVTLLPRAEKWVSVQPQTIRNVRKQVRRCEKMQGVKVRR